MPDTPTVIATVPDAIVTKARAAVAAVKGKYVRLSDVLAVVQQESHFVSWFGVGEAQYQSNLNAAKNITNFEATDISSYMTITSGDNVNKVAKFRCEPGYWDMVSAKGWDDQTKLYMSCSIGLGQKMIYYYADPKGTSAEIKASVDPFKADEDLQLRTCAKDLELWLKAAGGDRKMAFTAYNSGHIGSVASTYGEEVAKNAAEFEIKYPTITVDASALRAGIDSLNQLSMEEYNQDLSSLTTNLSLDTTGPNAALSKFARLVGVSMKQPFSVPVNVDPASTVTGASRTWTLDPRALQDPSKSQTWQFHTLAAIASDQGTSVADVATTAQTGTDFFSYLMASCGNALCGDGALKKEITNLLDALPKDANGKPVISSTTVVSAAGLALASALAVHIPVLATIFGVAAGPVLYAVMVIVGTIGVDAFCNWYRATHPNTSSSDGTASSSGTATSGSNSASQAGAGPETISKNG
jgi:hypothetical protein